MDKKEDIIRQNRQRCILALILCCILIAGVFTGVVTKLVAGSTLSNPDEGLRSFRYFTVLSNMLAAFCAALCIPYEIDGLRTHNYHLPRWAVGALYCGVCCVTVTFTVALCVLAPVQGFRITMLRRASLYLHLICPLSAMVLFIFINDDHRIPFRHSFLVLLPLFAYAFVYWLEVFVIGESNGGWRDHYCANVYFPYWIAMLALPVVGILLSNGIRVLHNRRHKKHKQKTRDYYLTSPDLACDSITDAIARLAEREKPLDKGGEVIVPRRLILLLRERYQSDRSLEELCHEYLTVYLRMR